jgi:outer membrane immunogenic protein
MRTTIPPLLLAVAALHADPAAAQPVDGPSLGIRGGSQQQKVENAKTALAGIRTAAENRDGRLIGAGVERILMPHLSARLEHHYSDFGDGGSGAWDQHQVLAGLAYRF